MTDERQETTMRFAILGISHETNTFSRVPTDYAQFEASDILRGQEIVERFEGSLYTIAGYLQAARELGFEVRPDTSLPRRSPRTRTTA